MSEPVKSQSGLSGVESFPGELWIACIEGPAIPEVPGRLIYRNAGNIVERLDISCLAAIDMAIRKFGVRRIVVCGHDGCRCIEVEELSGISGQWLIPAKRIDTVLKGSGKRDGGLHKRRLSELNVIEQVCSVAGTSVVKEALASGKPIEIVGLIFDAKTQEFLTVAAS